MTIGVANLCTVGSIWSFLAWCTWWAMLDPSRKSQILQRAQKSYGAHKQKAQQAHVAKKHTLQATCKSKYLEHRLLCRPKHQAPDWLLATDQGTHWSFFLAGSNISYMYRVSQKNALSEHDAAFLHQAVQGREQQAASGQVRLGLLGGGRLHHALKVRFFGTPCKVKH